MKETNLTQNRKEGRKEGNVLFNDTGASIAFFPDKLYRAKI